MSTNRRHGNSDVSKDPLLAAHWAVACVLLTAQVASTVYTQYKQHALHSQGRVKLQNIGTVWEVDGVMLALLLYPICTSLAQHAGNSQLITCEVFMSWGTAMGSCALGILMYRSLLFAYRVALIERAKLHHRESCPDYNPSIPQQENYKKHKQYINWAIKHLHPFNIKIGSFVLCIVCLCLIFSVQENRDYVNGKTDQCAAKVGSFTTLLWWAWVIPYLWIATKIIEHDPYKVLYKLKVQTVGMSVAFIIFLPAGFLMDPVISTAHGGLVSYEIFVFFWSFMWYSESYLPVALTWEKLRQIQTLTGHDHRYDLVDVLSDPNLLFKFERHLIKEWAVENLQFYKTATLFTLHLATHIKRIENVYTKGHKRKKDFVAMVGEVYTRETRRAIKIYKEYIEDGANSQVNLPSSVVKGLSIFFCKQMVNLGIGEEISMSLQQYSHSCTTGSQWQRRSLLRKSKHYNRRTKPFNSVFSTTTAGVASPAESIAQSRRTLSLDHEHDHNQDHDHNHDQDHEHQSQANHEHEHDHDHSISITPEIKGLSQHVSFQSRNSNPNRSTDTSRSHSKVQPLTNAQLTGSSYSCSLAPHTSSEGLGVRSPLALSHSKRSPLAFAGSGRCPIAATGVGHKRSVSGGQGNRSIARPATQVVSVVLNRSKRANTLPMGGGAAGRRVRSSSEAERKEGKKDFKLQGMSGGKSNNIVIKPINIPPRDLQVKPHPPVSHSIHNSPPNNRADNNQKMHSTMHSQDADQIALLSPMMSLTPYAGASIERVGEQKRNLGWRSHTTNPKIHKRLQANIKFCRAIANTAALSLSAIDDSKAFTFLQPNHHAIADYLDGHGHGHGHGDGHGRDHDDDDAHGGGVVGKRIHDSKQERQKVFKQIQTIGRLLHIFDEARGESFLVMEKDSFQRFIFNLTQQQPQPKHTLQSST